MALFVLGDTHLSLGASKPMDIFPGWNDYVERLEKNWRKLIKPEDTIVLAGDISWAMRLTDTRKDFEFLQSLPGQKIIMKGNHDYWWSTVNKMNAYLKAEGFDTLHILHNNSYSVEGYALCGTRGWLFDAGEAHDEKGRSAPWSSCSRSSPSVCAVVNIRHDAVWKRWRRSMRAPKSFEEGMDRLNAILAQMQQEDTSLADSVKLYAEAASLMQYCHATLEKTSLQIEEISAKIAETVEAPQEQEEE